MNEKADSLDKLLARINSRRLLPDHKWQFIKAGNLAYEYLIEKLDSTHLTDYQVIHIIEILVIMMYHGEPSEVIGKILDLTQDRRIRVRSYACKVAIVLLLQSENCGTPVYQLNRQDLADLINHALSIGLDTSNTSFAVDFINRKNRLG
jgi:hypothetical protein